MAVGAPIGARVRRPVLVVPLAFVSHFVLEAIPHLNVGWVNGFNVSAAADLGLGLVWPLRIHLLSPAAAVQSGGQLSGGEAAAGNVHSAEDWDDVLLPEIERQQKQGRAGGRG